MNIEQRRDRCVSTPSTEILSFASRDFRVIRLLLRVLSVWRPTSAGFLERYVYPITVNLLLLTTGILRNSIRAVKERTWFSIELLYLVHEMVVWLGHILGNRYFASRDLETNVLRPIKPLTGLLKPLRRMLRILNAVAILSMTFLSVMLCTLYAVKGVLWNKGAHRFSGALPQLQGPADHVLYGLVLLAIIYDLGIALALFWTLSLLYCCYAARLKVLEDIFLRWKHTSVDAVSLFMQLYARPVKDSWERISWWFIVHNIVALAIPLYGFGLAQAIFGREYHSKHLPQFICYLIFVVMIWLAPTFVGEIIKRREKEFLERINDISPWLLQAENDNSALDGESGERRHILNSDIEEAGSLVSASTTSSRFTRYTFACRGEELRGFLRFLKQRTPGLVSRGYSFQLSLSVFSLIGGAISFFIELHAMNNETSFGQCNGTMASDIFPV